MKRLTGVLLMFLIAGLTIGASGKKESGANAKTYPSKLIEFYVPVPAGAVIDLPARAVVELLDLGVPKAVLNKPGATQTTGTIEYLTRPADGYTVLSCAPGGMLLQPNIIELKYSLDDFRHLTAVIPPENQVLVALPTAKFKTWAELEAMLKAGAEVTWSTANPSSIGYLAMQSVLKQSGVKPPRFVPFTGSNEGLAALLGGHIDFYVIDGPIAKQKINEKQCIGLMVLDGARRKDIPDVPAASEFGFKSMEAFATFHWLAVHKNTPEDVVKILKTAFDKVVSSPQYAEKLKALGYDSAVAMYTEAKLTDSLKQANEIYKAIIKESKIGK